MIEPSPRADPQGVDEPRGDPPIAELFARLGADAAALVRAEAALAKAELRAAARALASAAAVAAGGGALVVLGGLLLLVALVVGLGDLLGDRYWLSALIAGTVLAGAGALLLVRGVKRARSARLAPEAALASVRETGAWARDEAAGVRAALRGRRTEADARRAGPGAPAVDRGGTEGSTDTGEPARTPLPRGTGSPTKTGELPPRTWPLWKRVRTKFRDDDVSNQAAKVAYYFFMSLPPLLMAVFGMAGMFGGDRTAAWLTTRLQAGLPGEAAGLVSGFVTEVVHRDHPGLLSIGLLLALWSGANVFMALEDSLNAAYRVPCARGFVKRRGVALATLVAVGLLFLAGSAVLLAGPAIAKGLGLGAVWSVVQWPVGLALVVAAFWLTYYLLPNRDQRANRGVLLKSSAIAAALFLLATLGFRLYATNFGSYSKTYGVLGGMIVLLLWMYYTSMVILLGGEIGAEMERG